MKNSENSDKTVHNGGDKSLNFDEDSLKGDYSNVALLVLLYMMQGLISGVGYALPLILLNKGNSYEDQAIFSLANYPFTVKLLWAPIVDSIYIKCFGRRKTWLLLSQLSIGGFMLHLSYHIDQWMEPRLDDGVPSKPNIDILTVNFLILFFFTATQDITVDGLAVNILKSSNRGYIGFCNQLGQVMGFTISYIVLLLFESKDFCNKYFFAAPRSTGIVTLSSFFSICGCGFILTTLLIAVFKTAEDIGELPHENRKIRQSYVHLWNILKLKNVKKFSLIIISMKFCVSACNGITDLKIVENGVPKEIFALLSFSKTFAKFLIPIVARKSTSGLRPLSVFMRFFPYRIVMISTITTFIFFIPTLTKDGISTIFCLILSVFLFLTEIPNSLMTMCELSFYAKISDPMIPSTYMTTMNTISNLGHSWIKTLFLYLMDILTWKSCISSDGSVSCVTIFDGYYVEIVFGVIFAMFWYFIVRTTVEELQNEPETSWHVTSTNTTTTKADGMVNEDTPKVLNIV